MTVATTTVLYVHHKFSKDEHDLIQSDLNIPNHYRFEHIVKTKIWLTLIVEISGAVILYVLFFREQVDNAVWQLIFHSISAFCIAGMSLFPSNLEDFKHNYSIQFVIIGLSVIGLLGFIVFSDFYCMMRYKKRRLIITSKIILTMLGIVVVLGTGPRCLIDLVYDRYFGV